MSLLIKALQKAELSKSEVAQGAVASTPPGEPAFELAPLSEASTSSLHEESGFDDLAPPSQGAAHVQREVASVVFRAGQDHSRAGAARAMWLAGGGLLFLLLLGGGFYYYLNSLEQPALLVSRPNPPPAVPIQESPVLADNVAPVPVVDEIQANETPAVVPAPPSVQPATVPQAPSPAGMEEPAARVEEKPRARPGEESPKVTRNRTPKATVSDDVMAGYQAYMAGDDVAAGQSYRKAVQQDARNVDAWLGLGAVAARQGRSDEAAAHYMRALELEPRNMAAQTGLIGLVGQTDPAASESRLKNLLAQQPEAAFLHAALGNLYADQGQWPSAQQAYFQAYRLEAGNAEYAFNLAVSLDQMGKTNLALTHYQRALELLPKQGGGLDRSQLEARIAQLQQVAGQ